MRTYCSQWELQSLLGFVIVCNKVQDLNWFDTFCQGIQWTYYAQKYLHTPLDTFRYLPARIRGVILWYILAKRSSSYELYTILKIHNTVQYVKF